MIHSKVTVTGDFVFTDPVAYLVFKTMKVIYGPSSTSVVSSGGQLTLGPNDWKYPPRSKQHARPSIHTVSRRWSNPSNEINYNQTVLSQNISNETNRDACRGEFITVFIEDWEKRVRLPSRRICHDTEQATFTSPAQVCDMTDLTSESLQELFPRSCSSSNSIQDDFVCMVDVGSLKTSDNPIGLGSSLMDKMVINGTTQVAELIYDHVTGEPDFSTQIPMMPPGCSWAQNAIITLAPRVLRPVALSWWEPKMGIETDIKTARHTSVSASTAERTGGPDVMVVPTPTPSNDASGQPDNPDSPHQLPPLYPGASPVQASTAYSDQFGRPIPNPARTLPPVPIGKIIPTTFDPIVVLDKTPFVVLGTNTIYQNGPPLTIAGERVMFTGESLVAGHNVIPLPPGIMELKPSATMPFASDQVTIFKNLGGTGEMLVAGGSSIIFAGNQYTSGGHTISVADDAVVVDGSSTYFFITPLPIPTITGDSGQENENIHRLNGSIADGSSSKRKSSTAASSSNLTLWWHVLITISCVVIVAIVI